MNKPKQESFNQGQLPEFIETDILQFLVLSTSFFPVYSWRKPLLSFHMMPESSEETDMLIVPLLVSCFSLTPLLPYLFDGSSRC